MNKKLISNSITALSILFFPHNTIASNTAIICKTEYSSILNGKFIPASEVLTRTTDTETYWDMSREDLDCKTDSNTKVMKSWLSLDSSAYDLGSWIQLKSFDGPFDYCQSFNTARKNEFTDTAQTFWGFYLAMAYPWPYIAGYPDCQNSDLGFPDSFPIWDIETRPPASFPRPAALLPVRGKVALELRQGTEIIYRYIPFRLTKWIYPFEVEPYGSDTRIRKGIKYSPAPQRQGQAWLLPSLATTTQVSAWDAAGHRLVLQRKEAPEGSLVLLPPGQGIAFLHAGELRWKILRP